MGSFVGPHRVWDATRRFGLATSRAFGDLANRYPKAQAWRPLSPAPAPLPTRHTPPAPALAQRLAQRSPLTIAASAPQANAGVIDEPQVSLHLLGQEDVLLVAGSDGIWDRISSQEAVDIAAAVVNSGAGRVT